MTRISKRGKKILTMVLALVLVAELFPNTALFEGWNVEAWASTEILSRSCFTVTVDDSTPESQYVYKGTEYEVKVSAKHENGTDDLDSSVYVTRILKETLNEEDSKAAVTLRASTSVSIKNVGTYYVYAAIAENQDYSLSDSGTHYYVYKLATIEVTQLDLGTLYATIDNGADLTYTGEVLSTKVSFTDSSQNEYNLVEGTDYTISYTKNNSPATVQDAGYYTATFTAAKTSANCTGSVAADFSVDQLDLTECSVNLSADTYTYSGEENKPTVTSITNGTDTISPDVYEITGYSDNVNAGTATVTISAKTSYSGNFSEGTTTAAFTINQKDISAADVSVGEYILGTGSLAVTVEDGTETLTEGANQDYTYAISKNGISVSLADILDQEEYTVTVTGHGNYTGTKTAAFTPQYFNGNGGTISPTTQQTDTLFKVTGTAIASFYNNLQNTDALTITLTDSTGYAIGTDIGNIAASAVTAVKVNEDVYIQEQSSGAISKYTVTNYVEDTEEPDISIVTSNNWDAWAKKDESKTFTVTATDDNGLYSDKVYYSVGEKVITASQYTDEATLEEDLKNASLTAIESGDTITVTDDLDETGVSYYVYAIDSAGNVATEEINVNKIDQKEPVIGGIQEGSTYCEAVTFTVADDNIDYVTVNGVAVTDYTLAADGSTYTVAAVDKAGNSATCTVTVRKGHNYEVTGTVAATYAEQGYTVYTCSVCGDSYRGDYTDVLTISEVDGIGTRMMIYDLTTVPEGLKGIYSSVEELINDLIRRVTVSEGYTEENVTVYDVVLQYLSADGTWVNATVDNFPTDGITITLPYPEGTDSSYEFVVLHMFTETSSRLGIIAGETESPTVTKTEEGLVVTVTGMSPIAISWKAVKTAAAETETTDSSASNTISSQTGDNSSVALWLALLSVSGAGAIGAAAYNRKRKYSR